MAQYDGTIRINTAINTDGVRRGEANIKQSFDRIASAAKKLASVIGAAFAVGGIVQFGKECIELGSDLQEVQNVVDVTFTTMSQKVNEFAKNAAVSAGLSETMAKRYVGTFGAMSKSFGFAEEEAYNMSTALTQLAGDVASFYNISQDEAYIKLKSVFTGETETLKDLGVVMTQAALDQYALANGVGKTTSKMTEQEKVALRYRFVMEQLAGASGDFARTSDSWANQTRILKLQFESLKATIGQGLINIFTPVIKVINTLLSKLATVANAFKAFTQLITGNKATSGGGAGLLDSGISDIASGYDEAAGAADNFADSTQDAAEAIKEAQKAAEGYLSPLDEINKISKEEIPIASDKGTSAAISGANVDYGSVAKGETVVDDLDGKLSGLKKTIEAVKTGFQNAFKADPSKLIKNLERIKKSNEAVWGSPEVQASIQRFKDAAAEALGAVAGSVASVTTSFAVGVTGGIAAAKEDLEEFRKIKISSIFDNLTSGANSIRDLAGGIATIGKAFESPGFQKIVEVLNKIVDVTVLTGLDYITGILSDLIGGFRSVSDNADGFRQVLEDIFDIVSLLLEPVENFWDFVAGKAGKYEDSPIHKFFTEISEAHSRGVEAMLTTMHTTLTLVKDVLTGKTTLGEIWKTLFGNKFSEIGDNIKNSLSTAFENAKNKISEFAGNVKTAIPKIISSIVGFFSELPSKIGYALEFAVGKIVSWVLEMVETVKTEVPKIITAIVNFFKELPGKIKELATEIINRAKEEIPKVIETITNFFKELPEKIWDFIKSIPEKIGTLAENLKTKSKEELPKVVDNITGFFKELPEKFLGIGKNIIQGLLNGIKNMVSTTKEKIGEFINSFLAGFKDALGIHSPSTVFAEFGKYCIEGLINGITGLIGALKRMVTEVWNEIKSTITDVWEKIEDKTSSIWNNITSAVKSSVNSIIGVINGMISGIVTGINAVINALNGLKFDIPDWVPAIGGKTFGFNLNTITAPQIPYLATGAVIPPNAPFMAMLGDQKHGTNIEAPLETIKQAQRESLLEVLSELGLTGNSGNNNSQTIIIKQYLDGKQVAESVVKEGKVRQMATGSNMFALGGTI